MPFVPVPKDLTRVKTKVAFNLTKRQLVCFGVGGLVGIPAYLFSRASLGNETAALLMIDHTCGGYRYYMNVRRIHQALFYDRTLAQAAGVMNAIFDWDIPDFEHLPEDGLGLDYIEKDTKAYIADVKGEIPVYPGIGIDMPAGPKDHIYRPCEPEYVRQGLLTMAKAGARGTVLSRSLSEMQHKNLVAAGEAIDEINCTYSFD